MQNCTTEMVSLFEEIFNPKVCYDLARQHQFIQRSSSLIQGHEFIKALVLPNDGLSEDSLNGLCLRMREFNPEVDISASALAQRINTPSAVALMKGCMQRILQQSCVKLIKQYECLEGPLKSFHNVYIEDSSVFEVNHHLHKIYAGTKRGGRKGGSSCKAQMKINLLHNFATGVIASAEIYEGKQPDQALAKRILEIVKEGDLIIRDLGYFNLEVFRQMSEIGAFFLSRLPSHVKVFLSPSDVKPIELSSYLNKKYKHLSNIEIQVWVGDKKLPVRLIACRTPQKVVNERRRKAHKRAREMRRTLSKAKLDLQNFNLFITNVPEETLATKVIGTVYRLRWEIELIFKQWKSILKIDCLKGLCRYRVEALMWARLCMAVIIAQIKATFMNLAKMYFQEELSQEKLIKYLIRNGKLSESVRLGRVEELWEEMLQDLQRRLLKDKRKRTTMREKVNQLEAYYEWGAYA